MIVYVFKRFQLRLEGGKLNLLSIYWDSSFLSQQGPLNVSREQTLATLSYLSQH
jgi:hypothetical protein